MAGSTRQYWIGSAITVLAVAFVTALLKLVITQVNLTTTALSFLLVGLAVASKYGLIPGVVASILGMFCFNYFFIPPVGTLTVHDPQNWVALLAFLVTAITASQLSSAARARARDAERRREEVMRLYQLSRAIIATPDSETAVSSIARQVVEVFGLQYCAVFLLSSEDKWNRAAAAGQAEFPLSEDKMTNALRSGEISVFARGNGNIERHHSTTYAPLKVGVRSIGVLVLTSSLLEQSSVEAIAGLVALAIERARFLKQVSQTEALRQSDELKSAILASVSHDLRTPLTSIRAAVDSLLQEEIKWDEAALREFHQIISEEVQRLSKLVHNLLEMARIEAGELKISRRWESISEMIYDVLDRCVSSTRNHEVASMIDENLPLVEIDARLIAQALTNLIENAAKYSLPGSEIRVRASVEKGELKVSVTDQGPGISPDEIDHIFDKFYRSTKLPAQRGDGTGMGLAIARGMVEAHGGTISAESSQGRGAQFTFNIPVRSKELSEHAAAAEEL